MSGRWVDSLDLEWAESCEGDRLKRALTALADALMWPDARARALPEASALVVVERRRLAATLTWQQNSAWDYRFDDVEEPTLLRAIDSLVTAMLRGGDGPRVTNLRTTEAILRSLWKATR